MMIDPQLKKSTKCLKPYLGNAGPEMMRLGFVSLSRCTAAVGSGRGGYCPAEWSVPDWRTTVQSRKLSVFRDSPNASPDSNTVKFAPNVWWSQ